MQVAFQGDLPSHLFLPCWTLFPFPNNKVSSIDFLPKQLSHRAGYNRAGVALANPASKRERGTRDRDWARRGEDSQALDMKPQSFMSLPHHFPMCAVLRSPGTWSRVFCLSLRRWVSLMAPRLCPSTFTPLFPITWSLPLPILATVLQPCRGPSWYQDWLARWEAFIFSF